MNCMYLYKTNGLNKGQQYNSMLIIAKNHISLEEQYFATLYYKGSQLSIQSKILSFFEAVGNI